MQQNAQSLQKLHLRPEATIARLTLCLQALSIANATAVSQTYAYQLLVGTQQYG